MVGTGHGGLVALELQVKILAEQVPIPFDGLFRLGKLSGSDAPRNLPTQTGRTHNQPLVVFLQLGTVCTRTHVESLGPRLRHQLDEVVVSLQVFGQHHQVITALVLFTVLQFQTAPCHVHLAPDDGFEQTFPGRLQLLPASGQFRFRILCFGFAALQGGYLLLQVLDFAVRPPVLLVHVVEEFLDAEHVAMVGHGYSAHPVGYGLIHQTGNGSLSVQNGILCMYM